MSVLNELILAASNLLKGEIEVARNSYSQWNGQTWVFDDAMWEKAAPEQFAHVKALREALKDAEASYQGKRFYALLARGRYDSHAHPYIFESEALAQHFELRVSDIAVVRLLEHKVKGPP